MDGRLAVAAVNCSGKSTNKEKVMEALTFAVWTLNLQQEFGGELSWGTVTWRLWKHVGPGHVPCRMTFLSLFYMM